MRATLLGLFVAVCSHLSFGADASAPMFMTVSVLDETARMEFTSFVLAINDQETTLEQAAFSHPELSKKLRGQDYRFVDCRGSELKMVPGTDKAFPFNDTDEAMTIVIREKRS